MKSLGDKLRIQNIFHYIIIFTTLVLLIIVVMGSYLYSFYYKTVYDSFCAENEESLKTVINMHENEMKILEDITMQIQLSADIRKFLLEEQPQRSIALKKQLKLYTDITQFYDQVLYFYQEDAYLYNHTTSINIDFFCKHFQLEGLTKEQLKALLKKEWDSFSILPERQVASVQAYNYGAAETVVFYVMPLIPDEDEILLFVVGDKYYDRVLQAEDRNNYIVYDGEVIVQRGNLEIPEEQFLDAIKEDKQQEEISIAGEKYLLTAQKAENGIVYVTLQSMDIFFDRMISGQWGIVMLLVVCCVPATFIILLGSNRLMSWFRNMNNLLNRGERSAYNMEEMQGDVLALVNAERESLPIRKAVFVRNFIRSDYPNKETAINEAKRVGMNVDCRLFAVALIGEREIGREKETFQTMQDIINQENGVEGYGARLISNKQKVFVLFANDADAIWHTWKKIFEVGSSQCEEFVMAVSLCHEEFTSASMAYVEASTAYDGHYLVDNGRIIYYGDMRQPVNWEIIPAITLQNLKNALKIKNKESVKSIIHEICERMRKERPSLFTFRWLYDDILRILLSEWSGEDNGWNQIYNVFTLSRCQSIDQFNELLTEACDIILENRTDVKTQQTSLAENAMQYMREHYGETELNMSMLAEYLQISSVTLALEFKNETGISPSDFLASIRMEQAKKLLRETEMLVKEISLSVGYEDDHVFMRRFKKYTGKTPGQYRKEM